MTTLSILIPHYNDPEGFRLTLASVESQTWQGDREVIVCDDGSEAEHVDKLRAIVAATSERVRLIENANNRGRPYTRNVLLDAADGKYLTWIDSGDEYYPQKLQEQFDGLFAAFHERLGTVWCTCNSDWQWEGARTSKLVTQRVEGDQITHLFTGDIRAYLYSLLGTTESFRDVGYFDLNLPRLQDLDFFLRFVSGGGRLVLPLTTDPLCIYHKSDVGRDGSEVIRCSNYIFAKHNPLLMARSRRFRRNRQSQQYRLAARFSSNNGERWTTARLLAASAAASPVAFTRWLIKSKGRL